MASIAPARLTVRDATDADVPALTAIKGAGSAAVHRDRLREARATHGTGFRYLVLVVDRELIGFACLVVRRPASWSDAGDTSHLPQIVDLRVKESQRGRGYGSALVRAIERLAAESGYDRVFLCVAPHDNPRASALYQRLGYQRLQSQPYRKRWHFTDSAGTTHRGEDWVVDMVKPLVAPAPPAPPAPDPPRPPRPPVGTAMIGRPGGGRGTPGTPGSPIRGTA